MDKIYFIQNEKGLFLTEDDTFVFVYPEENLKRFSTKIEAEEESQLYPNEKLIVRKFLNRKVSNTKKNID